jgi:vacuolar protein sorting-associated protein 13A/C
MCFIIANKFEAAMTPAEKAKLYQAIGYQENAAPAQYPPSFVAVQASFSLGSLQLVVRDEHLTESCVLKLVVAGVTCGIEQRPSALANK